MPNFFTVALTTELTNILALATELVGWMITTMSSLLTFITDNPLVLVYFLGGLFFLAIGGLMHLWHST